MFVLNSSLTLVNITQDFSVLTSKQNFKTHIYLIFVMCEIFMGHKTLRVTKWRWIF